MAKRIIYNENARRALEKGMDILAEAVAVTLGPKGRSAREKFGAPQIVMCAIAKEIELEDHVENTVSLIRQAASKPMTLLVMAPRLLRCLHAMVKRAAERGSGCNISLKRGIDKATS